MIRESSREAHEAILPHKDEQYSIIADSMKTTVLPATSEEIANGCELTYHQVARRLSEMERKGMIKVVGRKANVPRRPMLWDLESA